MLVDARGEYMDANTSPAEQQGFPQALAAQAFLYRVARSVGLVRLIGASLWGEPAMPHEMRTEGVLVAHLAAGCGRRDRRRARAADDALLQAAPSLGDRPLIVVAAGRR